MGEKNILKQENAEISRLISKYSRKRLYKCFQERVEEGRFEAVKSAEINEDGYSLLIKDGKILFQPKKSKGRYPLLFSVEDINDNAKGYLEVDGIFLDSRNKVLLLKSKWNGFSTDIVLEPGQTHLNVYGRITSETENLKSLEKGLIPFTGCIAIYDTSPTIILITKEPNITSIFFT